MDEIIKRILQIEEEAKGIVSEADSMKDNLQGQVSEEVQQYERQCQERARARIEKMRQLEYDHAQKMLDEIQSKSDEKAKRMEQELQQKRDYFVDEIVKRIVGDE